MLAFADIIDANTLIVVNAMLSAVSAMVMFVVHLGNRQAAGLRSWALSNLCFAVGFALLLTYGVGKPYLDALSANLMIDLGAIVAYLAVLRFLSRPLRDLGLIAPSLALMLMESVLFVRDGVNMSEMVVLGVTARGIVTFGAGWMLLRHADANVRHAAMLSAAFHFLWVAMLAARACWWLFGGYDEVDWDPTTPAALIARILLTFVVTPSYLWMLTRRLDFELMRQAREDALTGVANRRAIWDQAPRALANAARSGKAVCLLMIDVDYFKSVNDRFGHAMGDQVLVGVASALSSQLRPDDTIARVGGEEFMVLLPDIATEDAMNLADRLRLTVEKSEFPLPGGDMLRCTVSIGMSQFISDNRDWETLVRDADGALYCAKNLGRNRVELAPPHEALVPA